MSSETKEERLLVVHYKSITLVEHSVITGGGRPGRMEMKDENNMIFEGIDEIYEDTLPAIENTIAHMKMDEYKRLKKEGGIKGIKVTVTQWWFVKKRPEAEKQAGEPGNVITMN